jgi:hypothetical protein
MTVAPPDIRILENRIEPGELRRLVDAWFGDMVKYVADVRRGVIAIGGDLHADAEQVLLANGSQQEDPWGASYVPGRGRDDCIEYTSLINIRPARGNRGMEVVDPTVRARTRELTNRLIGDGEEV